MSFCLQVAGDGDVFPMLAIYAPYVRDTAITFEYEVPTRSRQESMESKRKSS